MTVCQYKLNFSDQSQIIKPSLFQNLDPWAPGHKKYKKFSSTALLKLYTL